MCQNLIEGTATEPTHKNGTANLDSIWRFHHLMLHRISPRFHVVHNNLEAFTAFMASPLFVEGRSTLSFPKIFTIAILLGAHTFTRHIKNSSRGYTWQHLGLSSDTNYYNHRFHHDELEF